MNSSFIELNAPDDVPDMPEPDVRSEVRSVDEPEVESVDEPEVVPEVEPEVEPEVPPKEGL